MVWSRQRSCELSNGRNADVLLNAALDLRERHGVKRRPGRELNLGQTSGGSLRVNNTAEDQGKGKLCCLRHWVSHAVDTRPQK